MGFFPDLTAFAGVGASLLDACTLPITVTAPGPGTNIDSFPVDHLMRSCPMTPVTTPSCGALVDPPRCEANAITDVGLGHLF